MLPVAMNDEIDQNDNMNASMIIFAKARWKQMAVFESIYQYLEIKSENVEHFQ